VRNGINLSNKQKYKYRECNKQFVLNPDKYISEEKGSDQKQEMILHFLCLFSVNYRFNQHPNLITTPKI